MSTKHPLTSLFLFPSRMEGRVCLSVRQVCSMREGAAPHPCQGGRGGGISRMCATSLALPQRIPTVRAWLEASARRGEGDDDATSCHASDYFSPAHSSFRPLLFVRRARHALAHVHAGPLPGVGFPATCAHPQVHHCPLLITPRFSSAPLLRIHLVRACLTECCPRRRSAAFGYTRRSSAKQDLALSGAIHIASRIRTCAAEETTWRERGGGRGRKSALR